MFLAGSWSFLIKVLLETVVTFPAYFPINLFFFNLLKYIYTKNYYTASFLLWTLNTSIIKETHILYILTSTSCLMRMLPEVNNFLVLPSFNVIFQCFCDVFARVEHGGFKLACSWFVLLCEHIDCLIGSFTILGDSGWLIISINLTRYTEVQVSYQKCFTACELRYCLHVWV